MHSTGIKIASALVLLLSLAGGVVVLGALSKATDMCLKDAAPVINQLLKGKLCDPAAGAIIPNANCPVGPQTMKAITVAATEHLQTYPALFQILSPESNRKPNSPYDCGIHLSIAWWAIALEVFCFLYGIAAVFFAFLHNKFMVMPVFVTKIGIITIATSIYVHLAYDFNGGKGTSNPMGQAAKTGVAGAVVVIASTYAFLFLFGSEDEAVSSEEEAKVEKH